MTHKTLPTLLFLALMLFFTRDLDSMPMWVVGLVVLVAGVVMEWCKHKNPAGGDTPARPFHEDD